MADRELSYKITTDSQQAVAGIKQFSTGVKRELKATRGELDDTRTSGQKVADALNRMADEAVRELQRSEEAAEALRVALGDAADSVDVEGAVADLRRLGLSFDEIEADAETLADTVRRLNTQKVDVDTTGAGDAFREVSDEAGKATDATNSFVGNAVSELPGVSEAFGPLGEAVGQLTEGLLGGEVGFKNLVAAAGPIAVITAAVTAVSGMLEANARRAEEATARMELLGEAMRTASDDALGLVEGIRGSLDQLREFEATDILGGDSGIFNRLNDAAKAIPVIGALAQSVNVNLVSALGKAGQSMYGFGRAVTGTTRDAQAFLDELSRAYQQGILTSDEITALRQAVVEYRDASGAAAEEQGAFNVSIDEANAIVGKLVAQRDPLLQYAEAWAVLGDDLADGAIDSQTAADAVNYLALQLGMTQEEVIGLAEETRIAAEEERDAEEATRDLAQANKEAADDVAKHKQKWDELFNRLDRDEAIANVGSSLGDLKQKGIDAYDAIKNKSEDAAQKQKEYNDTLRATKEDVANLSKEYLGLPPEVVTKILADLDQGKVDEVNAFIYNLSLGAELPVDIQMKLPPGWKVSADGKIHGPGGITVFAVPPTTGGGSPPPTPGMTPMVAATAAPAAVTPSASGSASAVWAPAGNRIFNVTINTRATDGRDVATALERWYRVNGGR